MTAPDVVYCMVTALFAAGAVHTLRHGVLSQSSGWRDRIDHLMHTAMALAMAVMPWSWGRMLPQAPQTAFFAAAALWFVSTAIGRRQGPWPAATLRGLPYAVGMAAMAWMTHSTAARAHETLADGPRVAHRAAHLGHAAEQSQTGDAVTGVLALCLLGCALRSLTRDMPTLRRAPRTRDRSTTRETYGHFWEGSMALGTFVMLLMHH
ncbi:DUF5134 domain-containing protein [Streptomyces spinoverrucosus]|uniref:DUF5134 domain-containing protein n=1 Tax=Streptomyces spinoverrucosus TaxID=284043 RepID=A0A4Y3VGU9_9ACTN|nr:DUF5134 domain-containing protein [Streptomyces spinoverrucosus]GEC05010.1 DUF5134 domain-containing protein [Streptomyces spinoverrucosus]GHB96546.1 DUF5134 domain-containing protein [Streptomyces spinoverrucosus]